jgi:MFS family permease
MGVVALFGDMTYEGARGIVGPYLGVLGASAAAIGFAAGLGEFLGYLLRLATGWFGDGTRAYWPLVVLGYAINLVAVPGLALVGSWEAAIGRAARADRQGDSEPGAEHARLVRSDRGGRWQELGIEEALDEIGAVLGPLLVAAAVWIADDDVPATRYRWAFAVLLVPVIASLALALFARRKYPRPDSFEVEVEVRSPRTHFASALRWYVAAAALLGLGFADWPLLAFHAVRTGFLGPEALPLVYAGVMGVDAIAALGFGAWFDRSGLRVLAVASVASAAVAGLVLLAPSVPVLVVGALFWGVGMGAQDSVFKAAIVTLVPKASRGRAYGIFYAVFGLAWRIGSSLMG